MSIEHRPSVRVISGAVAAVVLAAGAAYGVTAAAGIGDTGSGGIQASYAFDPYDKPKLMDFSDEVFFGRVLEMVKRTEDVDTVWDVEILDSIKGTMHAGRVQVQQHGYVDGRGRVHQITDSPLLEAGREYLLLTTRQDGGDDGELFLVSGPLTSPRADTAEQKAALEATYGRAAEQDPGWDPSRLRPKDRSQ